MMDRYILKDIAKAFIDMEFPEFLRRDDSDGVMFDNKGHFECSMKRYLTGAGNLTVMFAYANTSFNYELSESKYTDDDGECKHHILIYAPEWMRRVHIYGDSRIEHIVSIILKDVRKQFDEYDINDRIR